MRFFGQFIRICGTAAAVSAFTTPLISQPVRGAEPEASAAIAESAGGASGNSASDERSSRRESRRQSRRSDRADADASDVETQTVAEGTKPELIVVVEPKVECKRVTVVGSRLPKEVCTTVAEQDTTDDRNRDQIQDFQRRQTEAAQRTPPRDNPFTNSNLPGL